MLFCINVGEGDLDQEADIPKQTKHHWFLHCGKNTVLQSYFPLLAFCIANLWFKAYQALWHGEGNALASMSVLLSTCHCCARILGSLSGWQSSPCLHKIRQLLHSLQSSPGKLWNFRAEKAKPKLWSPCPSKKKPNRFNLKLPFPVPHPREFWDHSAKGIAFCIFKWHWPKVDAHVLGSCA